MSEQPETVVTVETPVPDSSGDSVVVVTDGGADNAGTLTDIASRLGAVEAYVQQAQAAAAEAQRTAEEAASTADVALDVAVDAADAAVEATETAEVAEVVAESTAVDNAVDDAAEDDEPGGMHFWWRGHSKGDS